MHFRPLHDRVVVRRLEGEEKTKGGIIIPDTAKEKPQEGEVLAVGPGRFDDAGAKRVPMDVKVGDVVLYSKYGGTEVKYHGEEYLVLSARAQKISRRAYWLSDPDLRQYSHAGLNKGEASNSVRRAVFFHHQGEIRDRPDQQARHPDNQIIGRAKKITWNRPSVRAGLGRAATPPHRGPPLPRTRAPRSARKLARRQA